MAEQAEGKTDFRVDVKLDVKDFQELTREAVKAFGKELEEAERAEIAAGGMGRYAKRTRVLVRNRGDTGWEIRVAARPNWMRTHEYGATSVGKTMLWIPAYWLNGEGASFRHRRARNFPGKLWRPPGTNILINAKTGRIAYVGVEQQTTRPNLHMRDIAEEKSAQFIEYLQSAMHA